MDQHFERIARRLSTLELRRPDADDDDALDAMKPGSPFGRVPRRFVGTYSAAGLGTVIHEYGLDAKLRAQGLGDYRLVVTDEDPFRHRLQLVLPEGAHAMDMHIHLRTLVDGADVVVVEWLRMQNPRARFTRERPRLPGQEHPGTGLGRDVAQLLVLMCRRIGRDGLVTVPERFHLAELYARGGWRAALPAADLELDDVLAGTRALSLAERAWAVARGFVRDGDGAPYVYVPRERVLPVSERMQARGFGALDAVARLAHALHRRPFTVDVEGLARSLAADPVEGMDPAHIQR